VIGRGRLGTVLAAALGAPPPLGRGDPLPSDSAVVVLAVTDADIASLAAQLELGPIVGHCSGALSHEVLAPHVERFSLHPLMSITRQSSPETLNGAGAAVAGSSHRSLSVARDLASRAGMESFAVADADRALYHAAASVASNFLVTLEAMAERLFGSIGVERRHVVGLARATLQNWVDLGTDEALTGPIVRGDHATVCRQRAALAAAAPDLLDVFDALVAATRGAAEA
jgi:predicted short-subunit dehydrogenase-like oxidoreductase (DUF2520 family)